MVRSHKNMTIVAALLFWFLLVCFVSYWSLVGEVSRSRATDSTESGSGLRINTRTGTELKDEDRDGLPDAVELRGFNNSESFRRWFTYISEMQFYKLAEPWQIDQRDCAGLVRFAWREAVRRHDHAWYQRMGTEYHPVAADVSYDLDSEPLHGKLFRTSFGVFNPADVSDGTFSEFADAQTLKTYNTNFVGRERDQARPGDLFIFHQPWVQKFPYHIMIFLGTPQVVTDAGHDWVVYHTGPTATDPGLVKKVRLSTLDKHPDRRWRPLPGNPNFIGIYRPKILDQRIASE